MTLMRFDTGGQSLIFTVGGSYPATMPARVFGTSDRTAGGTLQYEELGIKTRSRSIVFELMPAADYEALIDWFFDVAQGGKNSFQFTDEYGLVGDVVIIDQAISFPETSLGLYRGTLNLEYLEAPV